MCALSNRVDDVTFPPDEFALVNLPVIIVARSDLYLPIAVYHRAESLPSWILDCVVLVGSKSAGMKRTSGERIHFVKRRPSCDGLLANKCLSQYFLRSALSLCGVVAIRLEPVFDTETFLVVCSVSCWFILTYIMFGIHVPTMQFLRVESELGPKTRRAFVSAKSLQNSSIKLWNVIQNIISFIFILSSVVFHVNAWAL